MITRSHTTSFIVDAMLGSLARKLRIFGFDTLYFKEGDDIDLLRLAENESRAVVTADRELWKAASRRGLEAFVVTGGNDSARIRSLIEQAEKKRLPLTLGEPLCAVCNGGLSEVTREAVKGLVPEKVVRRHRFYYKCRDCGKVYWRGSHWSRLRRVERLLRAKGL